MLLPEIQMGNLDEKFIRLLAWQRVQQLFEPRPWSPQSNYISTSQPAQTQEHQSEGQEVPPSPHIPNLHHLTSLASHP